MPGLGLGKRVPNFPTESSWREIRNLMVYCQNIISTWQKCFFDINSKEKLAIRVLCIFKFRYMFSLQQDNGNTNHVCKRCWTRHKECKWPIWMQRKVPKIWVSLNYQLWLSLRRAHVFANFNSITIDRPGPYYLYFLLHLLLTFLLCVIYVLKGYPI